MGKRSVEDEMAELGKLTSQATSDSAREKLKAALNSKTNLIAGKAATVAIKLKLNDLVPDLIPAFDRFLKDPKFPDKGCVAKTAIAKALYEFGDRNAEDTFLAGIKHIQKEGSFGPPVDVATDLRGVCGLGLVRIGSRHALMELAELLADPEPPARAAAVRALAYSGRDEAAMLLRHKLLSGDREIDVLSECLTAIVAVQQRSAIPFVARFLDHKDHDLRAAAAFALGETRDPAALKIFQTRFVSETEFETRRAFVIAAAMLRLPQAIDWLISLLADEHPRIAADAIEALAMFKHDGAIRARVEESVARRAEKLVQDALAAHFKA
jgi:HEAT repeat protein